MAKSKGKPRKRKSAKAVQSVVHALKDYRDLAWTLTESYNGVASITEDLPLLDEEWVLEKLPLLFEAEDLETLLCEANGTGIVMGRLSALFEIEAITGESSDG